jgi:hypothetical protein
LIEERYCETALLALLLARLLAIDEAFGKVKFVLRRVKARSIGALIVAIGRALAAIASKDTRGWFGHCGYARWDQLS